MKLSKKQINFINKNHVAILSTCDLKNKPNSVFIEICKIENEENIIITDNEMKTTRKSLLQNNNICLLINDKRYKSIKIFGKASYYTSGKYFDYVKGLRTNIGYSTKGAVVIRVFKIIELL